MLALLVPALSSFYASTSLIGAAPLLRREREPPSSPRVTALAPSGVDELPYALQQGVVLTAFGGLAVGATASAFAYEFARRELPSVWWDRWETWSAATLGVTFVLAGRSHFTMPEAFKAIYPPLGTWGFWALPGSSDFHVAWTGVAELLGGSALLLGCLLRVFGPQDDTSPPLLRFAARAVLLLVLAVSPANVYMFTHGAIMPGVVDGELPMGWHAGRFIAQSIVLSVLLTISEWGPAAERGAAETAGSRGGQPRMQLSDEEVEAKLAALSGPKLGAQTTEQGQNALGFEIVLTLAALAVLALFVAA